MREATSRRSVWVGCSIRPLDLLSVFDRNANGGHSTTAWRTTPNRPECDRRAPDGASDGHSDLKRWPCAIDADLPSRRA
jgi:hypothetical protein